MLEDRRVLAITLHIGTADPLETNPVVDLLADTPGQIVPVFVSATESEGVNGVNFSVEIDGDDGPALTNADTVNCGVCLFANGAQFPPSRPEPDIIQGAGGNAGFPAPNSTIPSDPILLMNLTVDTTGFTTDGQLFDIHMDAVGSTSADTNFSTANFLGDLVDTFVNAQIRIVTPPTDPDAVDDSETVAEDSIDNVIDVLVNDTSDVGGRTITAVSDPDHGTATTDGSVIRYTPDPNYNGPDTFTYTIRNANNVPEEEDTATVNITVTSINDQPMLDPAGPFSVDENSTNGTAVGSVNATDADSAATPEGQLTYSISGTAFAIDNNGDITVADQGQLDFETMPSFTVDVTVQDGGTPALSDTISVTINLNDINEAPTVADQAFNVDENSANSTPVGTIAFTDPDMDNVTFTVNGSPGPFAVAPNGDITVAGPLDFESQSTYTISVTGTDDGSPALAATATVTINLNDINETPVVADQAFNVDENSTNSTPVGTIAFTDPDMDNVTFTVNGSPGPFAVAPNGDITVAGPLDFESQSTYTISVTGTDDGSPALAATATVTINLNDINETPVVADQAFNVDENSANSTPVGTIAFTDPDMDNVTFTVNGSPGPFAVAPNGDITVAGPLDFESQSTYTISVTGTDDGSPALAATATVTINLNDINETPVVADQTFDVDENSTNGTPVGTIAFTDPDMDNVTFTVNGSPGPFAVAPNGDITVAGPLDFESQSTYTISVTGTDDGSPALAATATVTINLNDINETPVVADQTFDVDENSTNGTPVGTIAFTDPDMDNVTFTVNGSPGPFAVAPNGDITVAGPLDFESQSTYTISVTGTDDGSPALAATATVTINLNDINETPVVADQAFNVDENSANGTPVGTIAFTDPDMDNVTFTVNGSPGPFAVAPNGDITVAGPLDFESQATYTISVTGTDDGSPALAATATVTINLNDINETPVVADQAFNVDENSTNGTPVGTIAFTDPDMDNVTFTVNGSPGPFAVTPNGDITVAGPLDFESQSTYTISVTGTDDGTPALAATATVTINLNDINEAPVVNNDTQSVGENAGAGTIVASVVANDPDTTAPNNTLSYQITSGDPNGLFTINAQRQVQLVGQLDFETQNVHVLTVAVSDGGTPSLSDTATITINVTDVNERPTAQDATVSIDENAPNGTDVTTVVATDPDTSGAFIALVYEITGGNTNNAFSIDAANGQVTVNDAAEVTMANSPFALEVTVTDRNGAANGLSDTATITVNVNNVNDPPTANPLTGGNAVAALEETPIVIRLTGDDGDGGIDQVLTFNLGTPSNGTLDLLNIVRINNSTIDVTYTPGPDFNGGDSFTFTVTDDDQAGAPEDLTSPAATVEISVAPINDEPSFTAGPIPNVLEDFGAVTINGFATFDSGAPNESQSALAYAITNNTNPGLFSALPMISPSGTLTYTPAPNANGSATITATVQDDGGVSNGGDDTSQPVSFTINVTAVNDEPSFTLGGNVTVNEDSGAYSISNPNNPIATNISAGPSDENGQSLTFDVANNNMTLFSTPPAIDSNGNLTFTPAADAFGTATLTVTLMDGGGTANNGDDTSPSQTVDIIIAPVNDDPVALDDSISFADTDTSPQTVTAPGVLVNDTDIDSPTTQFQVTAVDSNMANVGTGIVLPVTGATLTLNADGSYSVAFAPGNTGTDVVSYTMSDGDDGSATANLTISIGVGNQAPDGTDDTATTDEDVAVEIDVLDNDTDPDGDTIGIDSFGQGLNGTVTRNTMGTAELTDDTLTYTPNANFNGTDSFTYTATDGIQTAQFTVSVTIDPVNDPPVAVADSRTTLEDNSVAIDVLTNDDQDGTTGAPFTDIDGHTITIDSFTQPSSGTVMQIGNQLVYTPALNSTANDSFTYTITDGNGEFSTADVNVTVTPVNDAPVAVDDNATALENTPQNIFVLSNDSDVDGDELTITMVTQGDSGGSVTIDDNGTPSDPTDDSILYTSAAGFGGIETFTYTISDGNGGSDTASVAVTVDSNEPPVATDDTISGVPENDGSNTPHIIPVDDLLANDSGESGETLEIISVTSVASNGGTVVLNDNGTPGDPSDDFIEYTPPANFTGRETFDYTLSDNTGPSDNPPGPLTDTATVTTIVGDSPVFFDGGDLVVVGTDASDRIIFYPGNTPGLVYVRLNSLTFGPFSVPGGGSLTAFGLGGNDAIIGAGRLANPANFYGGVANDYLAGTTLDDIMFGGDGNDVILAGEGNNTADGGDGSDRIEGRSGADFFTGGNGNDRINGGDGDDVLLGESGNDSVFGGAGNDFIRGGSGDDNLSGYLGDDLITGDDGIDMLFGRQGNDVLLAGDGADRVRGDDGDDLLIGSVTSYDNNDAALLQILSDWSSGRMSAVNANNPLTLGGTVQDDIGTDELTGGTGQDWFFLFGLDRDRDVRSDDTVAS